MTVTSVVPDREARTLTLTAEYDAPVERVWQLWADPRLLERWWGPPTYPATVGAHDLTVGGTVTYVMTGPEGDTHPGWWRIRAVEAPTSLEFDDGFGEPFSEDLPVTTARVRISGAGPRTTMVVTTTFASAEDLDQVLAMGMLEGLTLAAGQIDDLLQQPVAG